ncbi:hypothetical protein BDY21DRAFT_340524 [Lineolata rhizophorae]|uniref:JmjC domain-containing protein n=1 Tax=Lineolata rhizophorae TaxID=578093 RepID=A0A6A6P525_9PEZI|nr:hypothetical protein BDY21DRAFT_340524 [Lineolata rhizophorae]
MSGNPDRDNRSAGALMALDNLFNRNLDARLPVDSPIHQCGKAPISILRTRPRDVLKLAHRKLHAWPYAQVPECWRWLYEEAAVHVAWELVRGWKKGLDEGGATLVSPVEFDDSSEDGGIPRARNVKEDWMTELVRVLDLAFIMTGSPGRAELWGNVMRTLEDALYPDSQGEDGKPANDHSPGRRRQSTAGSPEAADKSADMVPRPSKRIKLTTSEDSIKEVPKLDPENTKSPPRPGLQKIYIGDSLTDRRFLCHPIRRVPAPSLDAFQSYLSRAPSGLPEPLIITQAIDHFPALGCARSWNKPEYLMRRTLGGRRFVPVEIGRAYTDADWGQSIMPFGEFLNDYMLGKAASPDDAPPDDASRGDAKEQKKSQPDPTYDESDEDSGRGSGSSYRSPSPLPAPRRKPKGYLAQHDLLSQIPALRADVCVPDYCYSTPPALPREFSTHSTLPLPRTLDTPLLNAWFGPAGTLSPLHTDPYHNIFTQIVGHKYFRLYSPRANAAMHPRGKDDSGVDMGNTSAIDLDEYFDVRCMGFSEDGAASSDEGQATIECKVFDGRFPGFHEAEYLEGVVGPGECLYIPQGWWHYVRSMTPSCSVSFWWN